MLFWRREVLQDEFLHISEFSKWYSRHFSFSSYGPKMHLCLRKTQKWCFFDEKFFRMSSYTFQNFQNDILEIFHFHHIMLKSVLVLKKHQMYRYFRPWSLHNFQSKHVKSRFWVVGFGSGQIPLGGMQSRKKQSFLFGCAR